MSQISINLRKVLARLYSDELSIRRVIDDSGIDSTRIAFNATAINTWYSILTEAKKLNQVDNLLSVVEYEYGDNQELQDACHNYRKSMIRSDAQGIKQEWPSTNKRSDESDRIKHQLNVIDISGLKPGNSTYCDIVNKLGPPLHTNHDNHGNSILEYSDKGLHFMITGYRVHLDSVVDSIFIEDPYSYSLPYGLAINMPRSEVEERCNVYCKEIYQLRTKNSITYSHEVGDRKYGIELYFIGNLLRRVRYCVLL